MTIDWKKLKSAKPKAEPMMALILGGSGAGKSASLGTIGLKTLIIHGNVESHGPMSAKAVASNKEHILGLSYIVLREDGSIDAQQSYLQLLSILRDPDIAAHFEAVAVDSAGELQQIFKDTTKFRQLCTTDKGIFNSFKEPEAYGALFGDVINAMLALKQKGIHCFMTCAAIITGGNEAGDDLTAKPNLYGYTTAENLCRAFQDVLFVSLVKEEVDGEEKSVHRFLFNPTVGVTAKDAKGKVTKQSFSNFAPRLSYFSRDQLPDKSEVDFAKLIEARITKV